MKKVVLALVILSLNIFPQMLTTVNNNAIDKFRITGNLVYSNKYESPLSETLVYLIENNIVIDSCITDHQGKYSFGVKDNGVYRLSPKITKPWGPLSPACSLAILKASSGVLQVKDPLILKAVALGNGKEISAYDVALLMLRINGINNKPFPGGDWVSDEPEVTVDCDNANKNIKALCKGDILQSFIPDGVSITGRLVYDNNISSPMSFTTIFISYNGCIADSVQTDNIGAFNIQVKKNSTYTLTPQIRLPWFSVSILNVKAILDYYVGGSSSTSDLRIKAADVNNSGGVNLADALGLERRIRLTDKYPFPGGDWVSEIPIVKVADTNIKTNIKAILRGDFLGLYTPVDLMDSDVKQINKQPAAQENIEIIKNFNLAQNYPNPFNPETTIRYSVPIASNVRINIYNMLGQKASNLFSGVKEKGNYEIKFSASGLATGTYIYTITASPLDGSKGFTSSKKMLYLK